MRRLIFWIAWGFSAVSGMNLQAQHPGPKVRFELLFGNEPLQMDRVYPFQGGDLQIEKFRFYVSDFKFYRSGKVVRKSKGDPRLMDVEVPSSLVWTLGRKEPKRFDAVGFKWGLDSTYHTSGAWGGELDPTNGMYWSWQSGFIEWKLEGTWSGCQSRNHRFQFHVGGYAAPFATMREVVLPVLGGSEIEIFLDVNRFLESVDLKVQTETMSPGAEAAGLSTSMVGTLRCGK